LKRLEPAWTETVSSQLAARGYAALSAADWQRPPRGEAEFLSGWDDLVLDTQMGDGGRYRFRRYSRLLWEPARDSLQPLEGSSLFQTREDNPLNGGVRRTFEPLAPAALHGEFLNELVRLDWSCLAMPDESAWVVGVHCVRIQAGPRQPGLPTPEGIHRDAERFTVQHLIGRHNIRGGVFTAYDDNKQPCFHWKQLHCWDTLFFTGTLWHGATPIESDDQGHRDILLIDFDPA
jgi:hypothetical protein